MNKLYLIALAITTSFHLYGMESNSSANTRFTPAWMQRTTIHPAFNSTTRHPSSRTPLSHTQTNANINPSRFNEKTKYETSCN